MYQILRLCIGSRVTWLERVDLGQIRGSQSLAVYSRNSSGGDSVLRAVELTFGELLDTSALEDHYKTQ